MRLQPSAKKLPDSYFQLIKRFPLAHLLDDSQLTMAQRLIDDLLEGDLDEGVRSYLDVLTDLVEAYEEKHHPIADVSEADVLRELLRGHGMSQAQLAKKVGIAQSTLSAVVTAARSLTKEQIIVLAKYFHVAPATFLRAE